MTIDTAYDTIDWNCITEDTVLGVTLTVQIGAVLVQAGVYYKSIVAMKNVLATMQVASFMQDEFPLYMYLMSSWSQGSWNPIGIVFPWVVAIVWQVYQCVYVTRTVYTHCTVYHCCECVCVCVLIMIWDHYHQSQLRLRKPGCQMEKEEELWIIQAPSHVYKSLCPYCFLLLGRLLSVATLRCTE